VDRARPRRAFSSPADRPRRKRGVRPSALPDRPDGAAFEGPPPPLTPPPPPLREVEEGGEDAATAPEEEEEEEEEAEEDDAREDGEVEDPGAAPEPVPGAVAPAEVGEDEAEAGVGAGVDSSPRPAGPSSRAIRPSPASAAPSSVGSSSAPRPTVVSSSHVQTEEKKSEDDTGEEDRPHSAEEDPPLFPPFLDPSVASQEEQRRERESWVLVQLPTRLPRLDPLSTLSGSVKAEVASSGDIGGEMDVDVAVAASSNAGAGDEAAGGGGFDDTLRDVRAGMYGKIVVRRSGKAELVVGGGETGMPEVRMALTEGIRAGFARQAVSIDADRGVYVPLGDVGKDLVATPDVERAFPDS